LREHVRLRERPSARAELRCQLVEEAEVDVDVLRVFAGLAVDQHLPRRLRADRLVVEAAERAGAASERIATQQDDREENGQRHDRGPSADDDWRADARPGAAVVLDLRRVEPGVLTESHRLPRYPR
jgi:hypothetical protein